MKQKDEKLRDYSILYVEDNHEISEEIVFFLEPIVKNIYTAYNGKEGLELFTKYQVDIIISDIQMPISNGLDMIQSIREIDSEVPIIITTAFNEPDYLMEAINMKVNTYIMKPLQLKELLQSLYKIIEPLELKKELLEKSAELERINSNLDAIAKEKTKKLEYLYSRDSLTGLHNFVSLTESLEAQDYTYILLLDISNFSIINKQYGKVFSNKILKATGKALAQNATQHYKLFKVESDRFVFLTKESKFEKVEAFCQQLIGFFDTQVLEVETLEIELNFSFGIAKITPDQFPLVNAECALEIGKSLGGRYYDLYDESSEDIKKSKEMIQWFSITKDLIQNDMIEAYYQPIADVQSGKIVKYEVLVRGNYKGNIIAPDVFLEHAERLGLINSITRMIINKSFRYFSQTEYDFSINLTQRDLLDKSLVTFLDLKLQKFNIHPSRVTFEVLENVSIGTQHKFIREQLHVLKSMGFKIAIDDFGIENSNFSRLIEIDFDYIKLDGIFIKNLQGNTKDKIIVSAIVSLAKTLNVKTIAEYVENSTIFEMVKSCGIDMAQGYYIGKAAAEIKEK